MHAKNTMRFNVHIKVFVTGKLFASVSVCFLSGHCLLGVLLYCKENTSHRGEMKHLRKSYASRGVRVYFYDYQISALPHY